ncbi:unnamed protein product [Colias eurytheme]|nr:unnamed protein product [Colias eurytheme]
MEREDNFRLKRFKELKIKKAGGDDKQKVPVCSICKSQIEPSDICGLCKKCAKPKEPKPTVCPLCEKGDKEVKTPKVTILKKKASKQEIALPKKVSEKEVSKPEVVPPKQEPVTATDEECSCLKNAEGDVLQLLCASCQKKILMQNECSCLKKEEEEILKECSCPDVETEDENEQQRSEIKIQDECPHKQIEEKDQRPCQQQQTLVQNVCSCDQMKTKDKTEIPEIIIKDDPGKKKTQRHVSTQKDCSCDIQRPEIVMQDERSQGTMRNECQKQPQNVCSCEAMNMGDIKQSPSRAISIQKECSCEKVSANEQQQKIFINKVVLEKINKLKDIYLNKDEKEECSCGKNTQINQDNICKECLNKKQKDVSKDTCSICEKDLKKEKQCACNHSLACLTNVSGKSSKNSLCSNCKKEAVELKCSKSDPGVKINREACNQCQKEGIKPATKNKQDLRAVCSTCESKNDKIWTNQNIVKKASENICEKCKKECGTQNITTPFSANPSNDGLDSNSTLYAQMNNDLLKASSHINEVISITSKYKSSNSAEKLVGACKEVKSKIDELSLKKSKSNVDSKCSCKNLQEKDAKTSDADDSENLGVYVTKFQKVVTVKRYQNDDGTVKEEKRVVTITTESKNPSTGAILDDNKTKKQASVSPTTSSIKQKVSTSSTPSGKVLKITLPPKQKASNTTVFSTDLSINSYTSCNMTDNRSIETKSSEQIECSNLGQREPSQESDKCQCKSKSPESPATRSVSETCSINTKPSNKCCTHHNDPSQSKSCCTIKIVPKSKADLNKKVELANNCLELLKKILLESDQSSASRPSRKTESDSCSCNSQKSAKSTVQSTNVCSRCSSKDKVETKKDKPCCNIKEVDKSKDKCCHSVSNTKRISSENQCSCKGNLTQSSMMSSSVSNSTLKNNCCKAPNSTREIKSPKESSCNCRKEEQNQNIEKCICKQSSKLSKKDSSPIPLKPPCSCKTSESPKAMPSVCSMCKSKMSSKTPKSSCSCLLATDSNNISNYSSETECCPNKITPSCPSCSSKSKESTRKCNHQSGNVHQAWYFSTSVPTPHYQPPVDKDNEQLSKYSMCSLQSQCNNTPGLSRSPNNSYYLDNKVLSMSELSRESQITFQIFKSEQNCCISSSSSTPFYKKPQTIAFCPSCGSKPNTTKSCCNGNLERDNNKSKSQFTGSCTTPKISKDKIKVECSESSPSLKSCCNQTDINQCCSKKEISNCPLCKSKIKASPYCTKQPQTVSSATSTFIQKSKTCSCSKDKSDASKRVSPIPSKPPCNCQKKKELEQKCCSQPKIVQECCALAPSQKSCCNQTASSSQPQLKQSSCSCKSNKSNIGQNKIVGIKTASITKSCCHSDNANEKAGQCCKELANNTQKCCSLAKEPVIFCCKKPENDIGPKQSKSNCPICSSRVKANDSSCTCKSKDKAESNLNKNITTTAVCCGVKQQEQSQQCCKTPEDKKEKNIKSCCDKTEKEDSFKSNCPICSSKPKTPSCTCANNTSNQNNKEAPKESKTDNNKCSCNSAKAATPNPCCKEPKSESCPKENSNSCQICSDKKQPEEPSCKCGNKSKTKQENSCSKCGSELKPKPPSCICKKDTDKSKECCKEPEKSKEESCPICSKNKQPKRCSSCGSELPPKPSCTCAEKAKKLETPKPCCQQHTENKPCCNKEKEKQSQKTCTCSSANAPPQPKNESENKCTCTSKSNVTKPDSATKDKTKATSINKKEDTPEQCPICAKNKSKCNCKEKSDSNVTKKSDPCPPYCPSTQKIKPCPKCGSQKENKQKVERIKSCCCCPSKDVSKTRQKNSKVSVQTIPSLDCGICGPKTKNAETSTRRSDRYDVRNLEMIKQPQSPKKMCTCSSESYISLESWCPQMPARASSYHGRCFH